MKISHWEFPLAKSEYLLHYTTTDGKGGDKRKFWHEILGFQSAEALRMTILQQVGVDQLEADGQNAYGALYRLIVSLATPDGNLYRVRTVWIVRFGEEIARFVTAYPEQRKESHK
jgi:hypothetical protein